MAKRGFDSRGEGGRGISLKAGTALFGKIPERKKKRTTGLGRSVGKKWA